MPGTEHNVTLLFVDDEQENLNLFRNLFKRRYRVLTAAGGDAALALLRREEVAVLVCDQRMPGLAGTEVLARARELCPEAVRILVTAYPDLDVAVEAINQGNIHRYVGKPWEPAEIRAVIDQAAQLHALTTRNRELLEELQQRNEELQQLNEELGEVNASLRLKNTELAQANRELQRLDNVKTDLLTNVSHELRTPLVSVRGYTDLMASGRLGVLDERQTKAVGVIGVNVNRLIGLIEDLLDLSRLDRGLDRIEPAPMDVVDTLAETVQALEARAAEAEVTLTLQVRERPLTVDGDRRRLEQVFTNLIENAIKFNHPGGRVSVAARRGRGDTLLVEVADTGEGIPPDHVDRIFDRFYQVDTSSTRAHGGTGIGLALAREIVRGHGGTIRVRSTPGEGSTFTVELPAT